MQLKLGMIRGFNGGDYEECSLLWCYAMRLIVPRKRIASINIETRNNNISSQPASIASYC
jgi:hypothetical protein